MSHYEVPSATSDKKVLSTSLDQEAAGDDVPRGGFVGPFVVVPALITILVVFWGFFSGQSIGSTLAAAFFWQIASVSIFIGVSSARNAVVRPAKPVAYMIGADVDMGLEIDACLSSHGFKPSETASLSELSDQIDRGRGRGSIALVDIDAMPSVEVAVDELILFRVRHPGIGIILLSRELSGDGFSAERRPICDVSLQKPVSPTRIGAALTHVASFKTVGGTPRLT